MGIAVRGQVIESGTNIMVRGIEPSGIAARGIVVYEKEIVLPAGWELVASVGGVVNSHAPINTTGANILVIAVAMSGSIGSTNCSDNYNNEWKAIRTTGAQAGSALFYCIGAKVGPGHTFALTGAAYSAEVFAAFSGGGPKAFETIVTGPSTLEDTPGIFSSIFVQDASGFAVGDYFYVDITFGGTVYATVLMQVYMVMTNIIYAYHVSGLEWGPEYVYTGSRVRSQAGTALDKSSVSDSGGRPGQIIPSQPNALVLTTACSPTSILSVSAGFDMIHNEPYRAGANMAGALAWLIKDEPGVIDPVWTASGGVLRGTVIASFKG